MLFVWYFVNFSDSDSDNVCLTSKELNPMRTWLTRAQTLNRFEAHSCRPTVGRKLIRRPVLKHEEFAHPLQVIIEAP